MLCKIPSFNHIFVLSTTLSKITRHFPIVIGMENFIHFGAGVRAPAPITIGSNRDQISLSD